MAVPVPVRMARSPSLVLYTGVRSCSGCGGRGRGGGGEGSLVLRVMMQPMIITTTAKQRRQQLR
ncbi:hypothetical protein DY000_02050599 [Brassica cretica]|uniref:Uncharacterized protein n=1 Tax=Brassica cretica TaxID=69181 RepID=A0ABQ7F6B1_BRACR|nr:hypothetical protein DY000_02050599 [Brassica cretica]